MKSELITEASASLKKEIEKDLQVSDPVEGTVAMAKILNKALSKEEIKEIYDEERDTP